MIVRDARPDDVAAILSLVRELADYERSSHEVVARDEDLERALFGPDAHVHGLVVEVDGEIDAMALWFLNFSTWLGTSGLYLEDLYVRESSRGRGYGTALMRELAKICVARDYSRFEWSVLDWNTPSIDFYLSLGAVAQDEWTKFRLSGELLVTYALGEQPDR